MSAPNPLIIVDANVWLDNYLGGRPGSTASRNFIERARAHGAHLTYPVHCLNDFYYLMQADLKRNTRSEKDLSENEVLAIRETAWACVEHLRTLATAIAADESDAWLACKYRALTNDLEDNFVLAAAQRAKVDFIVTNDRQLLKKATVNAYTPADAALILQVTHEQRP